MIAFVFGILIGMALCLFLVSLGEAGRDEPKPPSWWADPENHIMLGTDLAILKWEESRRAYKDGYVQGCKAVVERALKTASWPEWGEMHVGDLEDALKEVLKEIEEADQ